MGVWEFDPLCDQRWITFTERNQRASVFHSVGWLKALKCTYGYDPVVYTTDEPGSYLANGWIFCRVSSGLTGDRVVSLPFSDHCDPLIDNLTSLQEIAHALERRQAKERWNYVECRPLDEQRLPTDFQISETFCFQKIDLRPDLDQLFRGLHKNSTQRKIKRAERENIVVKEGISEEILNHFFKLLVETRRRHKRLPQPRQWFSILADCMGKAMKVWVAYFGQIPIASIITLRFKNSLVYKYGCADHHYFPLGGMQLLLWRAVEEAKELNLLEFDLGRSDPTNCGLIRFKERFGATRSTLNYFRSRTAARRTHFLLAVSERCGKFIPFVPSGVLAAGGKLLYKHFG